MAAQWTQLQMHPGEPQGLGQAAGKGECHETGHGPLAGTPWDRNWAVCTLGPSSHPAGRLQLPACVPHLPAGSAVGKRHLLSRTAVHPTETPVGVFVTVKEQCFENNIPLVYPVQ